jgi:hypothetical protein
LAPAAINCSVSCRQHSSEAIPNVALYSATHVGRNGLPAGDVKQAQGVLQPQDAAIYTATQPIAQLLFKCWRADAVSPCSWHACAACAAASVLGPGCCCGCLPHLVHLLQPVSQQPHHGRASQLALQLTAPQQRVVPLRNTAEGAQNMDKELQLLRVMRCSKTVPPTRL